MANRKLDLLRRVGLFGVDCKGAVISRAITPAELREAYALVHDIYVKSGYIMPHPSGMRIRSYETLDSTATFIAKKDGRIVGVLSIVQDTARYGLPSDSAFRAELGDLRAQNLFLSELTNQAVDDPFLRSAVTTELMRCAVAHALQAKHDRGIATVSRSHGPFYEMMGFTRLGDERTYSSAVYDPVIALSITAEHYTEPRITLNEIEQFVQTFMIVENPYMGLVERWDASARAAFSSPSD